MNATEQYTPTPPSGSSAPNTARLVMWSWLMLPMMLLSTAVNTIFQVLLLSSAGLEGSEPLSEQGATGYIAVLAGNLLIWAVPAYLGVWLASRAKRAGATDATWPLVLNALIVAAIWTLTVVLVVAAL